jgi:hypothetical protein
MNNAKALLVSVIVSVVVVAGAFIFFRPSVSTPFGDFPGGVSPTQVWTANANTNSVTPVNGLPNLLLNGGLSVGGQFTQQQITAIYTASSSISATTTLGAIGLVSSTATSSFSIPANATSGFSVANLQVGDPCTGGTNNTSTFVDGCVISAVGGGNATGTFAYSNITNATLTTVTSTVFRFVATHLPY